MFASKNYFTCEVNTLKPGDMPGLILINTVGIIYDQDAAIILRGLCE